MGFLWSLVFLSLLTSSFSSSSSSSQQTYIVRVRNDLKPAVFSEVEHWYQSTLSSLTSSLLDTETSKQTTLHHVYKTVFHGFSAELTPEQADLIKARPEVLAIYPNQKFRLLTTRTPQFLGLPLKSVVTAPTESINDFDSASNVIIGVLDTGIWPESPSFNDTGLDSIPSRWKGECAEGQNFTKQNCNKKLIGARVFGRAVRSNISNGYNSPRDSEGHGTHTASTAAGAEVLDASFFGYAPGTAKGIAHNARIAAYKVCGSDSCSSADIVAGYDKAVEDGVDIISFSVGGPPAPYDLDPVAIAQFGAMEHNVFVSTAAGNDGPTSGTVQNIPPWVTTVGAGTIDRTFPADLMLGDGTVITGISLYSGPPLQEKKLYPLVYARNMSNNYFGNTSAALCMPGFLDPKLVKGKIVVCERGILGRVKKGEVVKNATAAGMVLVNVDELGESLIADAHVLPALALGLSAGKKVISYVETSKNPRATIIFRGTQLNVKPAPVVSGFSGRGPNTISDYIIKPDLIAPGSNILAAWPGDLAPTSLPSDTRRTKFNIVSGTSMSCPHLTGVAALVKAKYPDWSPSRIKSALMTTSYVVDTQGQPLLEESTLKASDVWAYGSGHVNPEKARDPGLVYDLTVNDYIDFLCASNYRETDISIITRRTVSCKKGLKPWDINYPSIAVIFNQTDAHRYQIAVTRTVTQVSEDASSYIVKIDNPPGVVLTVDPPKLEFTKKEQKLSYVVKVSAKKFTLVEYNPKSVFGRITWEDGKHVVSIPVAVGQANVKA